MVPMTQNRNDIDDDVGDEYIASRDNESPLIQACHRGHHDIVQELMGATNIKINQKRKTDGATALFVACREGAVECVRQLLTNNLILINNSKTNGRSPLFIASFFGHNEIVEMLMNHSHKMRKKSMVHGQLDVNQCDSKGFTPLFVAAQNGHTRIVTMLLKNAVCCDFVDDGFGNPKVDRNDKNLISEYIGRRQSGGTKRTYSIMDISTSRAC